jgi:hypothetical protein
MTDDIHAAAVSLQKKRMHDVRSSNGTDKCRQTCSAEQLMQACSGS